MLISILELFAFCFVHKILVLVIILSDLLFAGQIFVTISWFQKIVTVDLLSKSIHCDPTVAVKLSLGTIVLVLAGPRLS
jgi:hypothetical protein